MATAVRILAVVAALGALAGTARATSTDFLQLRYVSCGPTLAAWTHVPGTPGTGWTGPWYCGQYNLQVNHTVGTYGGDYATALVDRAGLNTPPYVIGSYCIEVRQEAPVTPRSDVYRRYEILPLEEAPIGKDALGNLLGQPLGARADDLRRLFTVWQSNFTNAQAAAFEAAVWEIVNETSRDYNVYGGDFRIQEYSPWGTGWGNIANGWLLTALDMNVVPNREVAALVNETYQDYALTIPGFGGSQVPEPVTMAGLVAGIGALVGYVRRRRQAGRQGDASE